MPLHILFLESSRHFGGQERRLLYEAACLSRMGYEVVIACPPESALYQKAQNADLPLYAVNMRRSLDLSGVQNLCRIIKHHKINIVYSHSSKDSWVGGLAALCKGIPLVRSRELLNPIKHRLSYNLLPARILACSAAVKSHLIESGINPSKVFVQYPPVDTYKFSAANPYEIEKVRKDLSIDGRFPVILCVAGFREEKRQIDAIAALEFVKNLSPEALLILVGSGQTMQSLQQHCDEINLSGHVLFAGEREDVPALLANADVFVLPSSREPFGMAPVEAMAAGVPVVVTKTGGLEEIITDGVNGILVPIKDPLSISEGIISLCRNSELRNRIITAGKKRALDFDASVSLKNLEKHFMEVVQC